MSTKLKQHFSLFLFLSFFEVNNRKIKKPLFFFVIILSNNKFFFLNFYDLFYIFLRLQTESKILYMKFIIVNFHLLCAAVT